MKDNYILGIDPSNEHSAYCLANASDLKPIDFGFLEENEMLNYLVDTLYKYKEDNVYLAIEGIQSFGGAVGKSVFDTCYLIGKMFAVAERTPLLIDITPYMDTKMIYRSEEKMNLCHSMRGINDSTIKQALVDRFAPYVRNNGKGTKKDKGWFYGFKADTWQAYAVMVTYYDMYYKGER